MDGTSLRSTVQLKSHFSSGNLTEELGFFHQKPQLLLVSVVFLFLGAIAVRVYDLKAPGLLPVREYRSAVIARAYYFETTNSVPEWRRQVAMITKQREAILEPPITELLAASIYRIVDGEHLWIARLLTSTFWLVGGIFLYAITKRVVSVDAAVFTTTYYLFVPLSILASRSFQPDPLMIMMFLFSLFTILRYYDQPSWPRLAIAAFISGLALFIKPLVLFTIFGAFISLAICKRGAWKRVINVRFLIFLVVSLLPVILYYSYGLFIAKFLQSQAQMSFRPHLLLHREYWREWLLVEVNAVGYIALIAALLGVPMLRKGLPRTLLIGLWIGYAVFGLVFNFHIHTHGYYHLQFIPIVALSFGPIVTLVVNHLRQVCTKWYWWMPVIGALLLVMLFNIREVRGRLGSQVFESEETAREIGEIVNHSSNTVYLAHHYGLPLQYYGELSGAYWPRRITYWLYRRPGERELSIEERLSALDFSPDYFIITNFKEFNRHHTDLKEFLANNDCPLVAESDQYLIYKVCTTQCICDN